MGGLNEPLFGHLLKSVATGQRSGEFEDPAAVPLEGSR